MAAALENLFHLFGREAVPCDMFRVSIVPVEAGDGHINSLLYEAGTRIAFATSVNLIFLSR
jgi:hypothetical protein